MCPPPKKKFSLPNLGYSLISFTQHPSFIAQQFLFPQRENVLWFLAGRELGVGEDSLVHRKHKEHRCPESSIFSVANCPTSLLRNPLCPSREAKGRNFTMNCFFPHGKRAGEKSEQLEKFEAKESYVIDPCHVCPSSSL